MLDLLEKECTEIEDHISPVESSIFSKWKSITKKMLADGTDFIVFPRYSDDCKINYWYVVCKSSKVYKRLNEELSAFVNHSYCEISNSPLKLNTEDNVERLILADYPELTFRFTPHDELKSVDFADLLETFVNLSQLAPPKTAKRTLSTNQLIAKFDRSINEKNFDECDEILTEIFGRSTVTFSNKLFLTIRLLGEKDEWQKILKLEQFDQIGSVSSFV